MSAAAIAASEPLEIAQSWRPLRLATLVGLRWLAIVGQVASVLVVALLLRFPLPLAACLGLIVLSAVLNIVLPLRFGWGYRFTNRVGGALLAFDCLQLGGLLWLTGGLENPFSILLLAPVSVSATTLRLRATVLLSLFAVAIASVLAVNHMPLPWRENGPLHLEPLYVAGTWLSLLLGVMFIAAYTNRVAHEARQQANALAATELALSRQQQLRALDGLAAAAAHELGTPLSTIALAAKEMRSDIKDPLLGEDVDLIITQVARCRAILGKLRNLESETGDPFEALPLGEMVAEAAQPHERSGKTILYEARYITEDEPIFARNVGLLYGLGNLIENAVYFARQRVGLTADWDASTVTLTITDDGPGFPPELVDRLGDPYITTRHRAAGSESSQAKGGLGLGIFIAKTLLERSGAQIRFQNRSASGEAEIVIRWPRSAVVVASR